MMNIYKNKEKDFKVFQRMTAYGLYVKRDVDLSTG